MHIEASLTLYPMPGCRRSSRVAIPSTTVLTPLVLIGAVQKLATSSVEMIIHSLIEELDYRSEDPDLEDEPREQ